MALLLVQAGVQPAGEYTLADGYTIKGGEVMVLTPFGVDAAGYPVVKARPATASDAYGPYYLSDDGLKGYGTLFGNTVVMSDTGFTSGADTATRLGPATYAASKKVTLWDKQGLYAVTLDALDPTVLASTWQTKVPGTALTVTSTGALTPGTRTANAAVATVVRFKQDESLVTTFGAVVSKQKLVIRFNPFGQV